jgi:hypothetical protein
MIEKSKLFLFSFLKVQEWLEEASVCMARIIQSYATTLEMKKHFESD